VVSSFKNAINTICFMKLCIFMPCKKPKGWLCALLAEFKGQMLKVKSQLGYKLSCPSFFIAFLIYFQESNERVP
jgi:hypothetical protein